MREPGSGRTCEARRTRRGKPRHAARPCRSLRMPCKGCDRPLARRNTRARRPRPSIRSMPGSPGCLRWLRPPDRPVRKEAQVAKLGWSSFILFAPAGQVVDILPAGTRNHPMDSISRNGPGAEPGAVRILPRCLSEYEIGVCPMAGMAPGGSLHFTSLHFTSLHFTSVEFSPPDCS
jgi:hypothetical protein